MKYLIALLMLFALTACEKAEAEYRCYECGTTTNVFTDSDDINGAAAVGIASSNLHFDHDNQNWQAGIGVGQYGSRTGGAVGLAKVLNNSKHRPLLSISVNRGQGTHTGGGAGLSFEF